MSINSNVFSGVNLPIATLYVPAGTETLYDAASVWQDFGTISCTPTDNTTTATACGSYTWANNNQTYTTSGIKTGTTTGCVTEKLDLTITTDPTNFSVDGINYTITSPTTVAVAATPGASGAVTIPTTVSSVCNTYSVTSIGYEAFASCSGLTSVSIPSSVTSIGFAAFYDCSGLTSVTIPNSVSIIGDSAFEACSSLTSITIPNSVTSIGSYAFASCSDLTSVSIPNSVTSIGNGTFDACSSLTSVTVSWATPLSINSNVFIDVNLPSATLYVPAGTETLYDGTAVWTNFGTICTPTDNTTTVTACGSYTWANNNQTYTATGIYTGTTTGCVTEKLNLTITTDSTNFAVDGINYIITSPTTVAVAATPGASGAVIIPTTVSSICNTYSVTSIGNGAFDNCTGLTSVTIPNSVTSIGNYAFYSCDSLASVSIPSSVISIGNFAFASCSDLTSVNIPSSVTGIGHFAFNHCISLSTVTIPSSVTSIGYSAFGSCYSLESVTVSWGTPLTIDSNTFQYVNLTGTTLYVPAGTETLYDGTAVWTNFGTICTPTDNVTTVTACDSYTWNGQNYTTTGVYTGTTANCVTEVLNLTINTTPAPVITTAIKVTINGTCSQLSNGDYYENGTLNGKKQFDGLNGSVRNISFNGTNWEIKYGPQILYSNNTPSTGDYPNELGWVPEAAAGCSSAIIVKLPTTTATQTVCSGSPIAVLEATGTDLKWYDSATSTTASASTDVLSTGSYFVTQTLNGCESPKTEVIVTVKANTEHITTITVCGSYFWEDTDEYYYDSGTYTGTTTNCVTEILQLTIGTPPPPTIPQTNGVYAGVEGVCDYLDDFYAEDGTLNGKKTFASTSNPSLVQKIIFDGTKWIVTDNAMSTIHFENTSVPTGDYPPTTGWFGVDCDTSTLELQSLSIPAIQKFCTGATVASLVATGSNLQWYDSTFAPVTATDVLVSGRYFVKQTLNGCQSSETGVSVTITSSTDNITTITACGSYVWNGTTYTSTGVYTGSTSNNCVTEKLDLTITPSTDNVTTATACGSYTWNGTTHATTGVYVGTTANCVTQKLNLTITPSSDNVTTITACDSYTWNNTTYSTTGTYIGTTTNCVTEKLNLTITPAANTTITNTSNTLSVAENGATYQWLTCGGSVYTNIAGATNQTYTTNVVGDFAVDVTINGCTTRSTCFNVTVLGADSFGINAFSVYPNPTTGVVNFVTTESINVTVFDVIGKLLIQQTITSINNKIDLGNSADGVYFINAKTESGQTKTLKVIKE